jgi:hypothetical protein
VTVAQTHPHHTAVTVLRDLFHLVS